MKIAKIVLDDEVFGYFARESANKNCKGCLFDQHPHAVCAEGSRIAVQAGQPDCDDSAPFRGNYIYVEADPHQLAIGEPAC